MFWARGSPFKFVPASWPSYECLKRTDWKGKKAKPGRNVPWGPERGEMDPDVQIYAQAKQFSDLAGLEIIEKQFFDFKFAKYQMHANKPRLSCRHPSLHKKKITG